MENSNDVPLNTRILKMSLMGYSYSAIQKALGNPSKKIIRDVIRTYDPELFAVLGDTKKLEELRNKRWRESNEE